MTQFSSFIDSSLFLRDERGQYLPATPEQILEIARRVVDLQVRDGMLFSSPAVVKSFLGTKLAGYEREVFVMLSLDTRHRFLDFVELFHGTIDGAEVHPREVVKRALGCNSAAVIVAHNHPSGDAEPSAADRAVTARLKQALALVDIRLLDHFVVGGPNIVSLAERGWV
ncbi:MAG: RadC family protein [Pseudoxanthomonas sp.]